MFTSSNVATKRDKQLASPASPKQSRKSIGVFRVKPHGHDRLVAKLRNRRLTARARHCPRDRFFFCAQAPLATRAAGTAASCFPLRVQVQDASRPDTQQKAACAVHVVFGTMRSGVARKAGTRERGKGVRRCCGFNAKIRNVTIALKNNNG